jgi:Acyl-CoA dehydrogenase, C-terminal domain
MEARPTARPRRNGGRTRFPRQSVHHSQVPPNGCYARELLGGNGTLLENHIGRFVADAEAIYSYEGTREMNTLIVGKAITGLRAFV